MRNDPKTLQLCAQVADAVHLALANSQDPRLCMLHVERVEPMRGASRLCVLVSAEAGADAMATLEALRRARGYLRREVAGELSRKRVPELTFALAPNAD